MNKHLTVLHETLSTIDTSFKQVNYGGCAVVAAFISQQLRTTFPVLRITSSEGNWNDSTWNLDVMRKSMSNSLAKCAWNDSGLNFNHVWVEILVCNRWYALDSTGVKPIKDMYAKWGIPAKGSFTYEEISNLAEMDDWNSSFDRKQIPYMFNFINKCLIEVRNFT